MWSLLSWCLLGALLATGTCLECEYCYGYGRTCSGEMRTCDENEDTCVTFVREFIQHPVTMTFSNKNCGKSSTCNLGVVEINIGKGIQLRSSRVCCTGDNCAKVSNPVLPPPDHQPNGFQCTGCAGIFSPKCHGERVACAGSQTACFGLSLNTGVFYPMEFALKGCASESFCVFLTSSVKSFVGADVDLTDAYCMLPSNVSTKAL